MSVVWFSMVVSSIFVAFLKGKTDSILTIISNGTRLSVENIFVIGGMICLWSGFFNILQNTNFADKLSKKLDKMICFIFNKKELNIKQKENISLNIASNLMGIGNAATVYSLNAINDMQEKNTDKKRATDNMTILTVINAASIQLIPTTMLTLRAMNGSKNPSSIIFPIWIVSIVSLIAGLVSLKILNKRG